MKTRNVRPGEPIEASPANDNFLGTAFSPLFGFAGLKRASRILGLHVRPLGPEKSALHDVNGVSWSNLVIIATRRQRSTFLLASKNRVVSPNEAHFLRATELSSPITAVTLLLVAYRGDEVLPLGSAVLIAAALAMTARHVIEEFWFRLGNGLPFFGARELKGEFVVIAVQYPGEKDDPALWRAEVGW